MFETLQDAEWVQLTSEISAPKGVGGADADQPSLRRRMEWAGTLFVAAGIMSLAGFVLVALGTASEISILGANFAIGSAFLSPLVPWGIGLIGVGVMFGFFGAAVKGPSVEWRDIPRDSEETETAVPRPPGMRYACPGCGGDVYMSQPACPACGYALPVARATEL